LRHSSAVLEATRDLAAAVQGAAELTHDDRAILDARDRAMAMERTAELLAADARNLLDIRQAEQSELQTAALERLSFNLFRLCLLVACLLPPAVLAGWCALNRQSPSWLADIYWWLAGGVAMLAGVLLWLTARRQRK
jgi:hypothetical protein